MKILKTSIILLLASLCSCQLFLTEESIQQKTTRAIKLSEPVNISEAKEILGSCSILDKEEAPSCERQVAAICLQKILRSKMPVEKKDVVPFMQHEEIAHLTSPRGDNMILKAAILGDKPVEIIRFLIENGNNPKNCRYLDTDGEKLCSVCFSLKSGNKTLAEFFSQKYPELLKLKCAKNRYPLHP